MTSSWEVEVFTMKWQFSLPRFFQGLSHLAEPVKRSSGIRFSELAPWPGQTSRTSLTAEREAKLLPALICTLFDLEGYHKTWPPTRVAALLDLAGLDRATTPAHLQGPNLPSNSFKRAMSRGSRQALLRDGLAALDASLLAEIGSSFDELSPVTRGYVLNAFARGDLGFSSEEAEIFIDCMLEVVTFAFLNFELELDPLPTNAPDAMRTWWTPA